MRHGSMKKKTAVLACVCAAALAAAVSGCGSREKPEVTLVVKTPVYQLDAVPDGETRDAYSFLTKAAEDFAAQYDKADVTVSVTQFEAADEQEEVADCFDTDGAADVLLGFYFNAKDYVYTGRAVPVEDILTEEIRGDIDEKYWKDSTVQGRVYLMPFAQSQNVLAYRRDLFREAGLEAFISDEDTVQSWTLEEWEQILATLRENLPEHAYPMMMYAADEQGDTHIMTLLRSCGGSFFDEDGMVCCTDPETLMGLQKLRDWNEKGYFPPDAETLVMLDNYNLFMNGQLAIYCCNASAAVLFDDAGLDYGLVNFPSADGKGLNSAFLTGFEVFDNGDAEKLSAAKDFVRFIYESDWLDYSAGGIPVSSRVAERYRDELSDKRKYIENPAETVDTDGGNPNWTGVRGTFYLHIQDLLYGEKETEQIARELEGACNAQIKKGYRNISLHE